MAEARNLKQREYGTDVLSHPDQNVVDYNRATRYNNNVRSNVFHNEPDHHANRALVQRRQNQFAERPNTATITRTSCQGSNIFGYQEAQRGTIQPAAVREDPTVRQRDQKTFQSNVFGGQAAGHANQREQRTFQSSVFGGAIQNPVNFKKIGGESHGTENLFGSAQPEYVRSSHNQMIAAPTEIARPQQPVKDAMEAKFKELYGKTAEIYGYQKNKRDGALMTSGADWKNPHQQATNQASPQKGKNCEDGMIHRDRKYQQLQSSVFGGGYEEKAPITYDKNATKVAFGSTADWKTEAGMAKPQNDLTGVTDTYRQKQNQLSSQVFEQTDYSKFQPQVKKQVDPNNVDHDVKVQPKGRFTDNEFKQRVQTFEPVRKDYSDYNAHNQKLGNLASAFGPQVEAPSQATQSQNPTVQGGSALYDRMVQSYVIPGRETKAVKQAMLASNCPITGKSSMVAYQEQQKAPAQVVDLSLKNLPADAELNQVKRLAGVKHVIDAQLDEDNFRGICKGTGRIQIRLQAGETLDQVEINYARKGIMVSEHQPDHNKKPLVTGPPKEFASEIDSAKTRQQEFLQTTCGETFGNSGAYQVRA